MIYLPDLTFTTQNQILHHGIQGQKWGVRNGPPYPLNRGDWSKGSSNSPKPKIKDSDLLNQWVNVTKKGDKWIPTALYYSDRKPTYSKGFSLDKMGSTNPELYKAIDNAKYIPIPPIGIITTTAAIIQDVKHRDEKDIVGSLSNNCTKCSAVMALKMMGYDDTDMVAGRSIRGYMDEITFSWFNNSKIIKAKEVKDYNPNKKYNYQEEDAELEKLFSNFDTMKSGSVGMLGMSGFWNGHEINFYKASNNELYIIDAQSGNYKKCSSGKEAYAYVNKEFMGYGLMPYGTNIIDLTEATPNWQNMAKSSVIGTKGETQNYMRTKANASKIKVNGFAGKTIEIRNGNLSEGLAEDTLINTNKTKDLRKAEKKYVQHTKS